MKQNSTLSLYKNQKNQKNNPTSARAGCFWGTPRPPPAPYPTWLVHRCKHTGEGDLASVPPPKSHQITQAFYSQPTPSLIQPVIQGCRPGFQRGLPLPMGEEGFNRWLLQINGGKKRSNCSGMLWGTALGGSFGQEGDCPADGAKISIIAFPPGPHESRGSAVATTEPWPKIQYLSQTIPEASPTRKSQNPGSGMLQPRFGVQPLTAASRLMRVLGWAPRDFPAPAKKKEKQTKKNPNPT